MPWFGRKPDRADEAAPGDPKVAGSQLAARIEVAVTDADGRIRVEDLLSAVAAVCGEACIAAAGEFDPERHDFVPGSAVLSDRINEILCANATEWSAAGESVFGLIFTGAIRSGYVIEHFPVLADVFRAYVGGLGAGTADRWGYVALGVPADNWPRVPPLRAAYEQRAQARSILREHGLAMTAWPSACAHAVGVELGRVRSAIDPSVAIRIVVETVNGMAKMAPMTDRHLRDAVEAAEAAGA